MQGTTHNTNNASVFLLMLILNIVQGLDYANIAEHSIKAIVTAFIWLVFKVIADKIAERKKEHAKEDKE
jgi:hypothetical protein